ncbi:MAG: magnesium transporter [Desulfurellaceae bacterium]|nr:magnesium transporter [Desulfurellaceae bacterium]
MTPASPEIERSLVQDFFERHPEEAADHLEISTPSEVAEALSQVAPETATEVFRRLSPAKALDILVGIDLDRGRQLIRNLDPPQAGALLGGLDTPRCDDLLAGLARAEARELHALMRHPTGSAGRLMDPRITVFRPDMKVEEALERLRSIRQRRRVLDLLIVDTAGRLSGTVPIQEVVLAESETTLLSLVKGLPVAVSAFTTREEIVETMERHKLTSIPVVDYDNKPLGIIRLNEMVSAVEEELSADLVSITGASKEERALSKVSFAIRKRLPWLQINLATAFLAAAVVGLFEDTISRFTALAVLLPVVAGQSGNTGAQALAVVLRGLALREITLRHWPQVVTKEFAAGLVNGLGIALVTCAGVYVWSGSTGLVFVIGLAMVVSMAIAGVAGAMIPVLLARMGQDPAQSSSIVLTTVTDVFGFFSFLGLAAVFSSLL